MSTAPADPAAPRTWVPLKPRERRVLGVLVEKAKTTPDVYPMTIAALVTGCNQKTNRDPITNYDADDVEDILQDLRRKGAAVMVEAGGRVVRWKHTLYDWLKVNKVELAVVAELLLRGAQTEGDLRARASRMEPLADLTVLQSILESLSARDLVVYLTPPGTRRGVVVTHGLYPPDELEKVRQAFALQLAASPVDDDPVVRAAPTRHEAAAAHAEPAWRAEVAALRAEMDGLKGTVATLAQELKALKESLGA
ncbi:MAG: YceH family protein [Isosphaeraceae bacterium]